MIRSVLTFRSLHQSIISVVFKYVGLLVSTTSKSPDYLLWRKKKWTSNFRLLSLCVLSVSILSFITIIETGTPKFRHRFSQTIMK